MHGATVQVGPSRESQRRPTKAAGLADRTKLAARNGTRMVRSVLLMLQRSNLSAQARFQGRCTSNPSLRLDSFQCTMGLML